MAETVLTFIKNHQVEMVIMLLVIIIIGNVSFLAYILSGSESKGETESHQTTKPKVVEKIENKPSDTIIVDISGAVVHPGAYTVSTSARLSHVLTEAGGLSRNADKDFFARNYNSAARLTDQQKIYVPRIDEIENGIFIENSYSIDHAVCVNAESGSKHQEETIGEASNALSINSASEQELDSLANIGPVTAKKIIEGRPYDSLDKLVELKILSQKVFDQLHDRLKL